MIPAALSSRTLRALLIALPILGTAFLSYSRTFDLYELQTYDWRCQLRGPRPCSPDIVFIDVWDDTLTHLGAWPFNREYHALLIHALRDYQPKALVFDILFVEPRPNDEKVVEAARAADNVYFPFAFPKPEEKGGKLVAHSLDTTLLPEYAKAAKGIGYVNTQADLDGKRRRVPPVISYQGRDFYQLSFRVAIDVLGLHPKQIRRGPEGDLHFGDKLRIPLDDKGYFLVNYAGKWESTFKHYSYLHILAAYAEVLSGQKPRLDLNELRGKICFIGLTSTGSHDTSPIPIQAIYPMVGSYANVLNGILQKDFIRRLDRFHNLDILFVLGFWIFFASTRLRPWRAFAAVLATLAAFLGAAIFVFIRWGWWVDIFYPMAVFVVIYAAAILTKAIFEIKKREVIENELKIASQIQRSFLPEKPPAAAGIQMAVYMKPAKAVGGDLYAFMELPGGKTGVMVGDVSGKGTPAALFMAKVVSEFKFSARDKIDPAAVLTALNDSVSSESTGGLFVTLSYAIFDPAAGKLALSNGGHLPVAAVDCEGQVSEFTSEDGMPIGVMPGMVFANLEMEAHKGDTFAFYSDGVSEARNRKRQEFGIRALQQSLSRSRALTAQQALEQAVLDLEQFIGKAEQHDDITLIVVKIGGAGE